MPDPKPSHCVICGHAGRGAASLFHMTHGVRVWLCDTHRHPRFLRRRNGRIFAERLEAAWDAAGAATVRRLQALATHLRRMDPEPVKPDLPGSYSWPMLRQLAEERYAAGDDPDTVIRELRALFDHETAHVPSVRTMRRWHAQGRWIHTTDDATAKTHLEEAPRLATPPTRQQLAEPRLRHLARAPPVRVVPASLVRRPARPRTLAAPLTD